MESATFRPLREPPSLTVYGAFSRTVSLGYRSKIMLVAFIGTHVPLLALLIWLLAESTLGWSDTFNVILVALGATLAGTVLTLLMLHHLLQPIVSTSRSLRDYLTHQRLPALPTQFNDEAGVLMRDVSRTLHKLDGTIRELTYYDHQTGLPNRRHFLSALERCLAPRSGAGFAVCLIEVVNFRQLVSVIGPDRTSSLLRRISLVLEANLDNRGQLSRINDRTLGFMLETDDSDRLASKVAGLLSVLSNIDSHGNAQPLYSAGVARHPVDGNDAGRLFDNAQMALSEAALRPGSHGQYSHENRSLMQARHRLEHELTQAIELNQFCLFYQPVIDSVHGRVVGAEAMIRWMHPDRGLQMPDDFIPLAERSDLIQAIGRWTLNEAGRQIRQWRDRQLLPGRIAVNLSARQFSDPALLQCVHETLDAYGLEGHDLELEVTETCAMADIQHSRSVLSAVQALGVSVAIDDFGTGYSSMSYLRNLPFDRLKIDRQFVEKLSLHPERLTICRALMTLADGLGMHVLAEGVETSDDVAALESLGCTRFQGFHYSRAVPPDEFETLLDRDWGRVDQVVERTSA